MSYEDKKYDDRIRDDRTLEYKARDKAREDKNYDDMSPEEIESDIELTRSRLDETLLAIEERLEPRQLLDPRHRVRAQQWRQRIFCQSRQVGQNRTAAVGIGRHWLGMADVLEPS